MADYSMHSVRESRSRYTTQERRSGMSTSVRGLEALAEHRMQEAARALEAAAREQEVWNRFGEEDPFEDDNAIAFKRRFPSGDIVYSYVAYKIKGHWYLSGTVGARLTWQQLVDGWLRYAEGDVEWATEWKKAF